MMSLDVTRWTSRGGCTSSYVGPLGQKILMAGKGEAGIGRARLKLQEPLRCFMEQHF